MSPQETVKSLLLSNSKLARLDAGMVDPQERIDIIHGLCADVGKFLDLGCGILDLIVSELETKLLNSGLDSIPAGQTMSGTIVSLCLCNEDMTDPMDT